MELGALVLVPENRFDGISAQSRRAVGADALSMWPVVGKNLVHDWVEKIRRIGAQVLSVPQGSGLRCNPMETARDLTAQGVEQLLLISLKSYAEIDLDDFVSFHRQSRNASTEAFDGEGSLGIKIVNRASLAEQTSAAGDHASEYRFDGYAKRLRSPQLYRDLVSDALRGRCALRPSGSQIDDSVWIGEDTQIAPTVRFSGPCFVGDGTVLQDFVSMGPFSSVENECLIQCGTAVEGSSILPNTFLSAGLNVRRSIVDGSRLENLDSGTVVDLRDCALGGRYRPRTKVRGDQFSGGRRIPTWPQPAFSPYELQSYPGAAAMIAAV